MSVSAHFRPTFADLRAEIERRHAHAAPPAEILALIDQFLTSGGEQPAPWVEYDGTVTWLYRDAEAGSVSVLGDLLGYDPHETRMTRLPGSDLFYLTRQMPIDSRIEYLFMVDPAPPPERPSSAWNEWLMHGRADPLNPREIIKVRPLRTFSVLEMPGARRVAEFDDVGGDSMDTVAFSIVGSSRQRIWRRVWVYVPLDYDTETRRYPTLYLVDGESYMLAAYAPQIEEILLAQGETVPTILVFVQSLSDAGAADPLDDRLVSFLADDVVPWVDARYATASNPADRIIGGASFDGTLSLYAALQRPDVFGGVIAQSPTARALVERVRALLQHNAEAGFDPPACYLDVGRYEPPAQLDEVHTLCNMLLAVGASVSYQEFAGDHSFVGWRTTLADALRFHFGAPPLPVDM